MQDEVRRRFSLLCRFGNLRSESLKLVEFLSDTSGQAEVWSGKISFDISFCFLHCPNLPPNASTETLKVKVECTTQESGFQCSKPRTYNVWEIGDYAWCLRTNPFKAYTMRPNILGKPCPSGFALLLKIN